MRLLSASEWIGVWERGAGQHPANRALTLIEACSNQPREDLAALALGQRDALLLEIYAQLFGDTLQAFAECPECTQQLEYSLSARELLSQKPAEPAANLCFSDGGISVRLRLLNSLDVEEAGASSDVGEARRLLVERCVVEAVRGGETIPAHMLPAPVIEQIASRLAEADPHAEMLIDLTCERCAGQWQIVFEVERFFWTKIASLARRLLREVHTLASAYGWSERDILALTPLRRQFYLEMVG